MDRTKVLAIGILVLIVAVAYTVAQPPTEGMSLVIGSYYEGELVSDDSTYSILRAGLPVDELRTNVEWTVGFTDIDLTTVLITGSITYYLIIEDIKTLTISEQFMDKDVFTVGIASMILSSVEQAGVWIEHREFSHMLNPWLYDKDPAGYDYESYGWPIHVYGDVTLTALDIYGNEIQKTWNADGYVTYIYHLDLGSLTLGVSWGY